MQPEEKHSANVIAGAQKCVDNAKAICSDAEYLLKDYRQARAFTLFHVAAEEASKAIDLVTGYVLGNFDSPENIEAFLGQKGAGRSHIKKIRGSISIVFPLLYWLRRDGEDTKESVRQLIKLLETAPTFTRDKERSLYVDYEKTEFSDPATSISMERCLQMKQIAHAAIMFADTLHKVLVPKAMEIRQQAKDPNFDSMKAGLVAEVKTWLSEL